MAMRNGQLLAVVIIAAAASITLAAFTISSPSKFTNRQPLVPGVAEWMQSHPETATEAKKAPAR